MSRSAGYRELLSTTKANLTGNWLEAHPFLYIGAHLSLIINPALNTSSNNAKSSHQLKNYICECKRNLIYLKMSMSISTLILVFFNFICISFSPKQRKS